MVTLGFRLHPEQKEALAAIARQEYVTISHIVRGLIIDYLKRKEQSK